MLGVKRRIIISIIHLLVVERFYSNLNIFII